MSETKHWDAYDVCHKCNAPRGGPCYNLGQYGHFLKRSAHSGRKRLDGRKYHNQWYKKGQEDGLERTA